MSTITFSEALKLRDKVFVDVRTPLEFSKDHIVDAINIPVLSNEQRALVGTIYKNENAKKAVDTGVSFFSERLPKIINQLRGYEGGKIIVYCWRGGMRSRALVSFMRSLNFDIIQLKGGYKSFRNLVREELYNFNIKPGVFCIHGMTGTGKTDIIKELTPFSIDLEGLARHRSSIFGHVGLDPHTQKMFENMLLSELKRVDDMPHIFLEGESRRIGNINLPDVIFQKIISSNAIKVFSDMPIRVKRIVGEYFDSKVKIKQLRQVLDSYVLINRLGKKNVEYLKKCLKTGDYEEFVKILLEKYYDPMYMHSQKRLKGVIEINSDNIDEAIHEIKKHVEKININDT
jgi:tRNA 2-selenouridine synthase